MRGRSHLLWWTLVRGVLAGPVVVIVLAFSAASSGLLFGLVLVLATMLLVRPLANLHRHWAGRVLGEQIARPYLTTTDRRWRTRLVLALRDPATGRDLLWSVINNTAGLVLVIGSLSLLVMGLSGLFLAAIWAWLPAWTHIWVGPVQLVDQIHPALGIPPPTLCLLGGVVLLALWWVVNPALIKADARLTRGLLAPTERALLAIKVRELAESRSETLDASAAELRRIERDLHDGPQARLVALGMNLGLAEQLMQRDPAAAAELLTEARLATGQALAELRDVVRGIHPPVLADRGLAGAAQALALAQPVPVHVLIDLPGRLPEPVESAAYFAVAEALANVARHSGAATAWLILRHAEGRLTIVIEDDGTGGADPGRGTGLRGIQRRLAAFDGTLTVTSPPGGPTVVTMEVPCESSSPRTSPSCATG